MKINVVREEVQPPPIREVVISLSPKEATNLYMILGAMGTSPHFFTWERGIAADMGNLIHTAMKA